MLSRREPMERDRMGGKPNIMNDLRSDIRVFQPVIDRDATCYNLVKAMAEECKTVEAEKKWKDVTTACGGASTILLAKSVILMAVGLMVYMQ